jgi:Fe-S-cluster containining protein
VFLERLTRLAANRQGLALTERADGVCVFLVAGNGCAIQAVKPRQCRDYPALWRSDALDRDCAGQRVGRAGCPRSSSDDPEPT